MTEHVTTHPSRIPFCSLKELHQRRRVTRWMDDLRDEVTAFLIDGTIVVRSSVCVHMGGEFDVDWTKRKVCCRWHGWEFDLQTGECLTFPLPGRRLTPYSHVVEEGTLYLLPSDAGR